MHSDICEKMMSVMEFGELYRLYLAQDGCSDEEFLVFFCIEYLCLESRQLGHLFLSFLFLFYGIWLFVGRVDWQMMEVFQSECGSFVCLGV